jgi:hypothetical protein
MMKPRTRKCLWFGILLAAAWQIGKMHGEACCPAKEYPGR